MLSKGWKSMKTMTQIDKLVNPRARNTGSSGFETSNQGVLKHVNYDEQEPIRVWSPSRN